MPKTPKKKKKGASFKEDLRAAMKKADAEDPKIAGVRARKPKKKNRAKI